MVINGLMLSCKDISDDINKTILGNDNLTKGTENFTNIKIT